MADFLATRMGTLIDALDPREQAVLVPVPTTRRRIRARGYSQAALLAQALARDHGRTLLHALERKDGKGTQVSLHPTQRRANVQNAFTISSRAPVDVSGRRVIVVDDVLTTGATGGVVAEVLQEAGAGEVSLATFARALPHRRRHFE